MSNPTERVLNLFLHIAPMNNAKLVRFLREKYGLKLSNFVHDELVLEDCPELTEEQLVILETEVKVLFG